MGLANAAAGVKTASSYEEWAAKARRRSDVDQDTGDRQPTITQQLTDRVGHLVTAAKERVTALWHVKDRVNPLRHLTARLQRT